MNFAKMSTEELETLNLAKLTQEQKEELLSVLETEIQIIEKETEIIDLDNRIMDIQIELIHANAELEKLKKSKSN